MFALQISLIPNQNYFKHKVAYIYDQPNIFISENDRNSKPSDCTTFKRSCSMTAFVKLVQPEGTVLFSKRIDSLGSECEILSGC